MQTIVLSGFASVSSRYSRARSRICVYRVSYNAQNSASVE